MQTVKPVYRIGAAGLDPRDWRLIEIVFKHSQYNRFEFVLAPGADPESMDILIANTNDAEGVRAVSAVRTGSRSIPVIAAVPRGSPGAARHAISIDRLTLQLLPILNRVVELELLRRQADSATTQSPGVTAAADIDASDKMPAIGPVSSAQPAGGNAAALNPAESQIQVAAPLVETKPPVPPEANDSSGTDPAPLSVFRTREPNAPNGASVVPSEDLASIRAPGSAETTPGPDRDADVSPKSTLPAAATPRGSSRPPPIRKLDLPTSPPHLKAVQNSSGPMATGAPLEASDPAGLNSNLLTFPKTQLSPPAPQQLRVLVVDDSPTVRQQLTGALIRMGLACVVVSSAAEALKSLEEQYFDLILLDVVMPDMDGYKLTRLIKRNRSLRQIPIILLTSRSSAFDLARGALAGCDTYLVKPVTLQALETAVFAQLRSSLAIDDLSAMLRPPPVAEPTLVVVTSNAPSTNTSAPRAAG